VSSGTLCAALVHVFSLLQMLACGAQGAAGIEVRK
jgi:hypothetical protein